jgi:hypothetical protein
VVRQLVEQVAKVQTFVGSHQIDDELASRANR